MAQLGQTKGKLQRTAVWRVAWGRGASPQGAVHELGAPLRWARWCLRVLDRPWPTSAALSDRQRAVLTKIDREQLEAPSWAGCEDYREAVEQWSQWHEVIQAVVRAGSPLRHREGVGRDVAASVGSDEAVAIGA